MNNNGGLCLEIIVGISLVPLVIQDFQTRRISKSYLTKGIIGSIGIQLLYLVFMGLLQRWNATIFVEFHVVQSGKLLLFRLLWNLLIVGILFLVAVCTREAIGYGDCACIAYLATVLSTFELLAILLWSFLVAALLALLLIVKARLCKQIHVRYIAFVPIIFLVYLFVVFGLC